jgi:predicted nicotinamide N-methyase
VRLVRHGRGILSHLPRSASPALRASLEERLRALRLGGALPPQLLDVRVERIRIDDGDPVHVARPDDWPALREAEHDAGRPPPYWAIPWPSGRALARAVAAMPPPRGARVLELGCGLGLPSIAAARGGGRVLAGDADSDAAVFAAHNLALNELEGDVLPADWRVAADRLAEAPYDLVLAADVLYLRENVESLLRVLPRLLAPGGEAWIADPGRTGADGFLPAAKRIWRVRSHFDEHDARIRLHRLRPR